MTLNFPDNLTPKMVKGIKGFNLCAYLVGLEGWRRGLNLKYYVDMNRYSDIRTQRKSRFGRSYSLSDGEKTHYFFQSRGDKVSNEAVVVSGNKHKTKESLKKNNISILPSIDFDKSNSDEEIIKKANEIGYPVIIKPTNGSLSKGVVLNIKDDEELGEALHTVRNKMGYKEVILERYFHGDDIRLYVVNNKVVAALRRIPAKVTGDGESTIEELINKKNKSRKNNPYLAARSIKINKETRDVLKKENYDINSVLEKGKTILVKNKSTMTQGVDLYDITDTISDDVKQLAIDTLRALPNIIHGSIDMLYDGKQAYVLEVNSSANISMHMFPTEGKPRNVPAHLIDLYFPETKEKAKDHLNMYFNYLEIVDILKKNYTNYIEVNSLDDSPIKAKRFIISGETLKKRYCNFVRGKAIERGVYGFLKRINDSTVEVVVASDEEEKITKFKRLCKKGPKNSKAKVNSIKSSDWNKEISVGFEII